MYNCSKCNKEFKNKAGKSNHENYCDGFGTKTDLEKQNKKIFICPKCNFEIKSSIEKHVNSCDSRGPRRRRLNIGKGQGWNKGKKMKDILSPDKYESYIEGSRKGGFTSSGLGSTPEKEEIRCKKIRKKILERYDNGWEVKCGRAPKYDYTSPIAGIIKVDGSWELGVAKYLDNINVKWERNKKRFKYINLKDKKSTYCPDFYIHDWNTYLEVKGYQTDLDECKWSQFKEPLLIWKRKELKDLKII